AISIAIVGLVSIHLTLAVSMLVCLLVIGHAARSFTNQDYLRKLTLTVCATALISLGMSAYWIAPLAAGRGPEGTKLADIGVGDITAFAAVPDPQLGFVPNLLGMYGFWAESTDRFTS